MLIDQIRNTSNSQHKHLEAILFPVLSAINNDQEYKKLLKAFYGYVQPVQDLIMMHINKEVVPDMDERRNAGLLLDDLRTLGDQTIPEHCENLPEIVDGPSALGALYVLEGSTLGGKIITKMLAEQLGSDSALSFFKGYGPETGKKWKDFTRYLEDERNSPFAETIVQTASQTFALFGTWLEKKLVNHS
ncbi:MAG: heme oxygenase-like protein [Ferruginibacter sp.]|nr:heme oxygenase-like protein [Ferruginibacter sp.]